MDKGVWQAKAHSNKESDTTEPLSTHTHTGESVDKIKRRGARTEMYGTLQNIEAKAMRRYQHSTLKGGQVKEKETQNLWCLRNQVRKMLQG